jgi:hypothetical protein
LVISESAKSGGESVTLTTGAGAQPLKGISTTATRELVGGMAFVLLIGALGIALGMQGWRSRIPDADVVSYIQSAEHLLAQGRIPDRGTLTSFGSYTPPGLSWLFLPGVALFSDPRLFGFIGSGMLHIGTLTGIFLLAFRHLEMRYALLSVLLYGFSEIGFYFAGALWPRGQPFFFVWMVYWTCLWAASGNAKYLAASLVTWAVGVYVFMELAPALFILPVVWFVYRPPVNLPALALAAGVVALIWYPYLRFESRRGFVDLRSQILMQDIRSSNNPLWCDPTLALLHEETKIKPSTSAMPYAKSFLVWFILAAGRRIFAIAHGLVINFEGVVPGMQFIMLGLVIGGLLLLSFHHTRFSLPTLEIIGRYQLTLLGVGLIVLGVVANEFVIGRYLAPLTLGKVLVPETISSIRALQVLATLSGIAILMRNSISRNLKAFAARFHTKNSDTLSLGLSLAVPWLVLLLVAEHGRLVRFFWLLPVQVIVLAACLTTIRSRLGLVLAGLLIVCSLLGASVFSTINAAMTTEWSGSDDSVVEVVGFVSDQIRVSGRTQASIGYVNGDDIPTFTQVYRVGADFDLLFKDLHGVSNTNSCAEGIAPDNEYRIIGRSGSQNQFVSPEGGFEFLKQFGSYKVYRRH